MSVLSNFFCLSSFVTWGVSLIYRHCTKRQFVIANNFTESRHVTFSFGFVCAFYTPPTRPCQGHFTLTRICELVRFARTVRANSHSH